MRIWTQHVTWCDDFMQRLFTECRVNANVEWCFVIGHCHGNGALFDVGVDAEFSETSLQQFPLQSECQRFCSTTGRIVRCCAAHAQVNVHCTSARPTRAEVPRSGTQRVTRRTSSAKQTLCSFLFHSQYDTNSFYTIVIFNNGIIASINRSLFQQEYFRTECARSWVANAKFTKTRGACVTPAQQ